jgi:hypothetical protein
VEDDRDESSPEILMGCELSNPGLSWRATTATLGGKEFDELTAFGRSLRVNGAGMIGAAATNVECENQGGCPFHHVVT